MAFASSSNIERSEYYGALQRVVDALFYEDDQPLTSADPTHVPSLEDFEGKRIRRLDAVIAAEAADLPDDLIRIVNLLPPGTYTRQQLCDQINSAICGHAWGQVYGTVS